jgi:hypothetical protein
VTVPISSVTSATSSSPQSVADAHQHRRSRRGTAKYRAERLSEASSDVRRCKDTRTYFSAAQCGNHLPVCGRRPDEKCRGAMRVVRRMPRRRGPGLGRRNMARLGTPPAKTGNWESLSVARGVLYLRCVDAGVGGLVCGLLYTVMVMYVLLYSIYEEAWCC